MFNVLVFFVPCKKMSFNGEKKAFQAFKGYFMPDPLLYIYIKYICFGLVWFDGISPIVGYLMPNPLYTYIFNIYDYVWLGLMVYQPL